MYQHSARASAEGRGNAILASPRGQEGSIWHPPR